MEKETLMIFLVLVLVTVVCSVFGTSDVYMHCPADSWFIGNQVTLFCSVLKRYMSRCVLTTNEAEIRRSSGGVKWQPRCTLADITTTCTSSSSDCKCCPNSTHFNFQYTFTLDAYSSGYWDCNIDCRVGAIPQLSYDGSDGCKDRSVAEREAVQAVCLPEIWEVKRTVTIQCFLQKSKFPSSCATSYANKTHFRHSVDGGTSYSTVCTVSDILGKCTSSGPCGSGAGNSTHYMFTYTFEVHKAHKGYWGCDVPCLNGRASLTYAQVDCKNKKVIDLSATKTDSSPNCLVIGVAAAGGVFVIAAVGAGVYCIRERVSAGKQNAAPAKILPDNAHPENAHPDNAPVDNAPLHNAPLHNAPLYNAPLYSSPPANDPLDSALPPNSGALVAGSDEESTSKTDDSITDVQLEESTVDGSEASEATDASVALSD